MMMEINAEMSIAEVVKCRNEEHGEEIYKGRIRNMRKGPKGLRMCRVEGEG